MTLAEFKLWFDGYAQGLAIPHWDAVDEVLRQVKEKLETVTEHDKATVSFNSVKKAFSLGEFDQ